MTEKLISFLKRSGTRQELPLLLLIFNIVPEFLISAVRQKEEIKLFRLEIKKTISISSDMNVHMENPQISLQSRPK